MVLSLTAAYVQNARYGCYRCSVDAVKQAMSRCSSFIISVRCVDQSVSSALLWYSYGSLDTLTLAEETSVNTTPFPY